MRNLLPLLGLCFRARRLAAGEEPAEAAVRARDVRVLLLASDAADNTVRRVEHFAKAGNCPWLRLPYTKAEVGGAVGRASCAILAVTDIGFAASIVRRLAEQDSAMYGETAELLERRARRAAERKEKRTVREDAKAPPRKQEKKERRPSASRSAPHARRRPNADRWKHSRPVKKGKGSFRKKD